MGSYRLLVLFLGHSLKYLILLVFVLFIYSMLFSCEALSTTNIVGFISSITLLLIYVILEPTKVVRKITKKDLVKVKLALHKFWTPCFKLLSIVNYVLLYMVSIDENWGEIYVHILILLTVQVFCEILLYIIRREC